MELTMSEKQARKAMLKEIIEAENMGIHKYVDAIKMIPEHCKMLKSIMNEEFQHIKLLNELVKDLGEVPEMMSLKNIMKRFIKMKIQTIPRKLHQPW